MRIKTLMNTTTKNYQIKTLGRDRVRLVVKKEISSRLQIKRFKRKTGLLVKLKI
jgi:hypothetical protein